MQLNSKLFKFITLAVKSLLQHKLRATLSILGVVCGVAAVLSMFSIGEGAKRESLSQIEQLGTTNIYVKSIPLTETQERKSRAKLSQGLTLYDAQRIKNGCRDVREIAGLRELKASVFGATKDIMPQIISCSPNYASMLKIPIFDGRFISDLDMQESKLVCVIGHNIAKNMGASGSIGNFLRIENSLFQIIGILRRIESKERKAGAISLRNYNDLVFIPLTAASLVSKSASVIGATAWPEVTELVVGVSTAQQVLKSVPALKRTLEITHGGAEDYQIVVPQELLNQSRKIQRTFNIVLGSIAFISLLVGGIGIMNIMLATVSERTKEIGVRRAFGATYSDIIIQFLAESIILTFTGGIIGIIIGLGGVWLISAIAKWNTAITMLSLVLPLLTSILVGIFFGLYPAYEAAKMDPIAALRYE
ncbi:MAG: ABC transporter permease [Desulfobacteraceae bacterium]|nr:MAG: ABC transporter permease [Desulfobacteraceae bacterium]